MIPDGGVQVDETGKFATTTTSTACLEFSESIADTAVRNAELIDFRQTGIPMRALASIGTFILALVVVTVMLTAVSVLCALDSPTADLRIEDIESGNLVPMLLGNTLWSSYPGFPLNGSALLDYYAVAFASVVASACVVLHRSSLKCPPLVLAIGSIAAGCIPYTIGAVVLRTIPHTPYESGGWVSLMILGVAYCACVSLVCSCVDLATPVWVAWRDRRVQAEEPVRL